MGSTGGKGCGGREEIVQDRWWQVEQNIGMAISEGHYHAYCLAKEGSPGFLADSSFPSATLPQPQLLG